MRRRDRARLAESLEWMAGIVDRGTALDDGEQQTWDAHRAAVLALVDDATASRMLEEAVARAADARPAPEPGRPSPRPPLVRIDPVEAEREAWRKVVAMRRGWNRVIAPTPAEPRSAEAPEVLRAAGRADMRRWTPWR